MSPTLRRPTMRRAVVLLPNGFTLGNLFFGLWAIVSASRGEYSQAGLFVVFGGVMDALDGRVARMTRTNSRFGVELDSLVDTVSFGVAPAFIMYFAVLSHEGWAWLFVFIYVACVVMRLARFNIEQGGRAKTHFHGLPSPAAGMTLASYWWFSQTSLYRQTIVGDLPWTLVMKGVMLLLAWLMISDVIYPAVPTIGVRSVRGIVGIAVTVGAIAGLLFVPKEFFFPALFAYVAWGVLSTFFFGMLERLPTGDPLFDGDDEDDLPERVIAMAELPMGGRRRRRRRGGRREGPHPRSDESTS